MSSAKEFLRCFFIIFRTQMCNAFVSWQSKLIELYIKIYDYVKSLFVCHHLLPVLKKSEVKNSSQENLLVNCWPTSGHLIGMHERKHAD